MARPQALVGVVAARRDGGVITTDLHLMDGQWPTDPMAPATIWRDTSPPEPVLELHRLVARDDGTARFETYGQSWSLPPLGASLLFYAWWTPDQLEVAQSTGLGWTRTMYEARDHDHCLLTWETIRRGEMAFVSAAGWITEDAYRRYIQDDELRLRPSR